MTPDELIAHTWTLIEEAQREANRADCIRLRKALLQRRDILTELRRKMKELQATIGEAQLAGDA